VKHAHSDISAFRSVLFYRDYATPKKITPTG